MSQSITILNQVIKLEGQTNQKQVLFKKTAIEFKKKYGIELANAPLIFKANECIYKLSHLHLTLRGKVNEFAMYEPLVGCGDKFDRLRRDEIKVK